MESGRLISDPPDPLRIASADAVVWHDSADVVVVGFGAAGAVAALEMRECAPESDVLILERFDGGGATAFSGGVLYVGGSRHQREAGYEDSAEEMYKYLRLEAGEVVRDETLRSFCSTSNDNLEWLERHGVRFGSTLHEGKAAYPPTGKFLYFSGNEKVAKYRAEARPAPRGHRTVGKGLTGGSFFEALRQSVEKSSIRVQRHTPVNRLVVDAAGRILGVEVNVIGKSKTPKHQALYRKVTPMLPFQGRRSEKAIADCGLLEQKEGERRLVRARCGVVLATGGFTYNLPLLKTYTRATFYENCLGMARLGSMGCSGVGILLGQSVGAATGLMDSILISRLIAPPATLVEGLLVNCDGRRFINEDTYNGFLGDAISRQREGKAWLLFDHSTFRRVMRELFPSGDGTFFTFRLPALLNLCFGGTRHAADLKMLALKCGIDESQLRTEIESFNTSAATGLGDPMGKVDSYVRPLGRGPYHALNMSLSNRFASTMTFTLGGLKVDESSGVVLNENGGSIEGLYAIGRTAVGVCSKTYFSGMSLSDCVFSGRRAARHLCGKYDSSKV